MAHGRSCCLAAAVFILMMMFRSATTTTTAASPRPRRAHLEPPSEGGYRTYIVLLEPPPPSRAGNDMDHRAWHESLLPSKLTDLGEPRLIRLYTFLVNGFAARLTEAEVQQLASKPGFIRAFPNTIRYLQTTHTPAFLGLQENGADSSYGAGVIIGFLDVRWYRPIVERHCV